MKNKLSKDSFKKKPNPQLQIIQQFPLEIDTYNIPAQQNQPNPIDPQEIKKLKKEIQIITQKYNKIKQYAIKEKIKYESNAMIIELQIDDLLDQNALMESRIDQLEVENQILKNKNLGSIAKSSSRSLKIDKSEKGSKTQRSKYERNRSPLRKSQHFDLGVNVQMTRTVHLTPTPKKRKSSYNTDHQNQNEDINKVKFPLQISSTKSLIAQESQQSQSSSQSDCHCTKCINNARQLRQLRYKMIDYGKQFEEIYLVIKYIALKKGISDKLIEQKYDMFKKYYTNPQRGKLAIDFTEQYIEKIQDMLQEYDSEEEQETQVPQALLELRQQMRLLRLQVEQLNQQCDGQQYNSAEQDKYWQEVEEQILDFAEKYQSLPYKDKEISSKLKIMKKQIKQEQKQKYLRNIE